MGVSGWRAVRLKAFKGVFSSSPWQSFPNLRQASHAVNEITEDDTQQRLGNAVTNASNDTYNQDHHFLDGGWTVFFLRKNEKKGPWILT